MLDGVIFLGLTRRFAFTTTVVDSKAGEFHPLDIATCRNGDESFLFCNHVLRS